MHAILVSPQPAAAPEHEAATPQLSVIIPALNEEKMIGLCLGALCALELPAGACEVIVVDNGSSDRTVEVAGAYASRIPLTVLRHPGVRIAALRNRGAAVARARFLAFLDADCIVSPDWGERSCRQLEAAGAAVIGGGIEVPRESSWVARSWYGAGYAPANGEVTYVPSGNMLIARANFERIGGFNEQLETSEDCELCFRACSAGMKVCAVSELAVVHLRTPQTLSSFYRRERWHGTHVARVFLENLPATANLAAVAFALYMLLGAAGMAAGVLFGVWSGRWQLLAAALGAMILAALLVTLRKLRPLPVRQWGHLLPLTVLHLVWGLARARALLSPAAFRRRRRASGKAAEDGLAR